MWRSISFAHCPYELALYSVTTCTRSQVPCYVANACRDAQRKAEYEERVAARKARDEGFKVPKYEKEVRTCTVSWVESASHYIHLSLCSEMI